jgi:hypothetical protein
MVPVFVEHLSVDDGVFNTFRLRYQSASAAWQIVTDFRALGGADGVEVEDRHIRRHPGPQHTAISETEEPGWLRSDPLHRTLKGERLLLAYERT